MKNYCSPFNFYFFFTAALFFLINICFSQITFQKVYSGIGNEYGYGVIQTYDNGYAVTGETTNGNGISNAYILRTDSLGALLWEKHYGGSGINKSFSIIQANDSGFIIAGFTNSFGFGGYDIYVIKTDKNGDTIWTKSYGSTDWDFAYTVKQTSDGNFVIAGGTYGSGIGNENMYLIKINPDGDTLWTKIYGGLNDDEAKSVRQTSDGGYILSGFSKSFGNSKGDIFIVKTDQFGDTLWTYLYPDTLESISYDALESINGEYIIAGNCKTSDLGWERIFIRLSPTGQFVSKNVYWGIYDDEVYSIVQPPNGGLAITGYTYSYGVTQNGSSNGYIILESPYTSVVGYAYGDNNNERLYSISNTSDGGFVMCGFSNSYTLSNNIYLVKTDSNAIAPSTVDLISTNINNIIHPLFNFTLYPNPAKDKIFINFSDDILSLGDSICLTLTDMYTRVFYMQNVHFQKSSPSIEIQTGGLHSGIYVLSFSCESFLLTRKIIIQH